MGVAYVVVDDTNRRVYDLGKGPGYVLQHRETWNRETLTEALQEALDDWTPEAREAFVNELAAFCEPPGKVVTLDDARGDWDLRINGYTFAGSYYENDADRRAMFRELYGTI